MDRACRISYAAPTYPRYPDPLRHACQHMQWVSISRELDCDRAYSETQGAAALTLPARCVSILQSRAAARPQFALKARVGYGTALKSALPLARMASAAAKRKSASRCPGGTSASSGHSGYGSPSCADAPFNACKLWTRSDQVIIH